MTTGTTSPSYIGASTVASSVKPSTSSQATTNQSSFESEPARELKKLIPRTPKNLVNPNGAGLDDFGRAYVSLIRYLKAVFPSREGKKADRESTKKKKQSGPRSTRTLELQLQLQQELLRCEWLRDGHVGWRLGPLDLPLPDHDHNQSDVKKHLLPATPLGSIRPPRSGLQAAK